MPLILNVHYLSQPARAVDWFADYAGVEAERNYLDLFEKKDQKKDDFIAKFPAGQVPTLEHDGFYLEESAAVLHYLSEHAGKLRPATIKGRAEETKWLARHQLGARRVTIDVILPLFFAKDEEKAEKVAKGIEALEPHLKKYEARLEKSKYIAGDELTIADFLLITEIDQLELMQQMIGKDVLASYPSLKKYLAAAADIPGYKKNLESTQAFLAKMAAAKKQ